MLAKSTNVHYVYLKNRDFNNVMRKRKNTFLNVGRKYFHRISLMPTARFQYFENYHRRILTVQTCSISKTVYTV